MWPITSHELPCPITLPSMDVSPCPPNPYKYNWISQCPVSQSVGLGGFRSPFQQLVQLQNLPISRNTMAKALQGQRHWMLWHTISRAHCRQTWANTGTHFRNIRLKPLWYLNQTLPGIPKVWIQLRSTLAVQIWWKGHVGSAPSSLGLANVLWLEDSSNQNTAPEPKLGVTQLYFLYTFITFPVIIRCQKVLVWKHFLKTLFWKQNVFWKHFWFLSTSFLSPSSHTLCSGQHFVMSLQQGIFLT